MTKKQKRLGLIGAVFFAAAGALALSLAALQTSITYFYTPSELAALETPPARGIRLGGLVEEGSIQYGQSGDSAGATARISFVVTDGGADTKVNFEGLLPDLFREGQGVVVEGRLGPDGALAASNVLAKHDENYMPKEVMEALKEQGRWQEGVDG